MGLVPSRLNLEALHSNRRRSQQDEALYSYSLNKNYFSNYFLMGGERFEVNDPDYLFGDNCDLNFLSCTKPYSLPYKQAQQNLLSNLNTKQKAISNKRPNNHHRMNRLGSTFNILGSRQSRAQTDSRKQDAQTQTFNSLKGLPNVPEPSQPLVMFVNIRKETLRLVKSSNQYNLDSELNSLTNSISNSPKALLPQQQQLGKDDVAVDDQSERKSEEITLTRARSSSKHSRKSSSKPKQLQPQSNRHSAAVSRATTSTIHPNDELRTTTDGDNVSNNLELSQSSKRFESDVSSLLSATSSTRSGYTSVKEPSYNNSSYSGENDDDEYDDFKDALNDTTNFSAKEDDDDDSEQTQQQRSLLGRTKESTKENRDIKITIEHPDDLSASNSSDIKTDPTLESSEGDENLAKYSTPRASSRRLTKSPVKTTDNNNLSAENSSSRVYNIEFNFDAEVDCSIRIFYFCTREITSNGINYKPQHATYKSKIYYYKKGLNQKFDQQEHTFQPYLFDEDLLIYKPLDLEGNYNSGAVFPIVIHCVALEGSTPMQSHSLVATIEKSQLDDSYSIKPLKQLIFVDGVQYILQDIYGIEHKQLSSASTFINQRNKAPRVLKNNRTNLRLKSQSVQSNLDAGSSLNLSDTASLYSLDCGGSLSSRQNRGSTISNQHKSLGSENTFECVICMSEERDTMLLPCRHLCLCSSCAQSLRYQASSCPICRSPFKAALNLRPVQRHPYSHTPSTPNTTAKKSLRASSNSIVSTSLTEAIHTNQDSAT